MNANFIVVVHHHWYLDLGLVVSNFSKAPIGKKYRAFDWLQQNDDLETIVSNDYLTYAVSSLDWAWID